MITTIGHFLLGTFSFIVLIAVLVMVHEFGHWIAARLQGFGIQAFSIGMGPILWQREGKEGGAFQIRWLPIGGFVKLVGEMGPDSDMPEEVPDRKIFFKRKRWERFLVMVMGAAFNVLFAFLLFAGIAWYGMEETLLTSQPPRVSGVRPGYPAQAAGIQAEDVILSIGGRKVSNWMDAREEILTLTRKSYVIIIDRGGEEMAFRVTPTTSTIMKQEVGDIGIFSSLSAIIGVVDPESPAGGAGMKPGDEIVSINGHSVQYWDQLQTTVATGGPGPHLFGLRRDGEVLDLEIAPAWIEEEQRWVVGVMPKYSQWTRYPFPSCFAKSASLLREQSQLMYRTIRKLVTRKMGMNSLSGPVGIAYIAGQAALTSTPIYDFLFLMAVFSLQLGLLNLLPIPILDGGHIFILGIEGLPRRDLPDRVKERLLQIGLVLLLLLFASVLLFDILKFIP